MTQTEITSECLVLSKHCASCVFSQEVLQVAKIWYIPNAIREPSQTLPIYWHDNFNTSAPFLQRTEEHISWLQVQRRKDNQWDGGTLFYYYVALGCLIVLWNPTNRKWRSLLPSLTVSLRFLVRSSHAPTQPFLHVHSEDILSILSMMPMVKKASHTSNLDCMDVCL